MSAKAHGKRSKNQKCDVENTHFSDPAHREDLLRTELDTSPGSYGQVGEPGLGTRDGNGECEVYFG